MSGDSLPMASGGIRHSFDHARKIINIERDKYEVLMGNRELFKLPTSEE